SADYYMGNLVLVTMPIQAVTQVIHHVPVQVQYHDPVALRSLVLPVAIRDGEAPLVIHELARGLDDLGVDHHPGTEAVLGIEDGDPSGDTHLIGRETDARSGVHGLDHVLDQ